MGGIGGYGDKIAKNMIFKDFCPFLVIDEWLLYPIL